MGRQQADQNRSKTPSQYQTRVLNCKDCKQDFEFTIGEQEFFAERNFTDPTRCKPCREQNKQKKEKRQNNRDRG